jgi:hypothetical protein
MGIILKGICKNCGYETENLYYGGGFRNPETCCNFPGIDKVKKVIRMKNIMDKEKVRKDFPYFTFYNNKSLFDKSLQNREAYHEWGDYKLYFNGYLCPKCTNFSIEFMPVALWD